MENRMTHRSPQEDLVVAGTYSYRHEAEIGRSMLEANGVKAIMLSEDLGGIYPPPGASMGVGLLMRQRDEMKARKLLA
jgi:hypothetical protein